MSGTDLGTVLGSFSFQRFYTILKGWREKFPYPGVVSGTGTPCIMKGLGNIASTYFILSILCFSLAGCECYSLMQKDTIACS